MSQLTEITEPYPRLLRPVRRDQQGGVGLPAEQASRQGSAVPGLRSIGRCPGQWPGDCRIIELPVRSSAKRSRMKKHDVALVVPFLAVALAGPSTHAEQASCRSHRSATKRPHTTEIHGYTLKDDYFWLREKSNPEVIKYLEGENAYTEEVMKPTKGLQETLYTEMLGRIKQTDLSVPSRIGDYFYYSRTEEGKQYPYHAAGARAAWTAPKRSCSISTRWPKATSSSASAPSPSATTATGWPTRPTRPAIVSTACTSRICARADARREHRARRLGRVGDRQQDALLHDRRRGLEAIGQVLASHGGRGRERSAVRGEERAVRRRLPAARSTRR